MNDNEISLSAKHQVNGAEDGSTLYLILELRRKILAEHRCVDDLWRDRSIRHTDPLELAQPLG
jgi:hypothetical protein